MGIGLTFDEYVELRQTGETFPLSTTEASRHLYRRGYDCKPPMLEHLVQHGIVKLSRSEAWTQADVDAAAQYFEQCEVFTPYAAMCQTLGCRYADFLRPLREAAERESARYGRAVPDSDQYFVMHRVPPRSVTDENGNLVEFASSVISFTLCDDIRERLERGEEV